MPAKYLEVLRLRPFIHTSAKSAKQYAPIQAKQFPSHGAHAERKKRIHEEEGRLSWHDCLASRGGNMQSPAE